MTDKGEQKPSPDTTDSKEAEQNPSSNDEETKDLYRNFHTGACHTLLSLKGIILVATIVLVSSAVEISKVKPCHLKKELVSLSVDYASACKYDDIKENTNTLCNLGIFFLVLNSIIFLLILIVMWIPKIEDTAIRMRLAGVIVIAFVSFGVSTGMLYYYIKVLEFKENQTDTNYAEIKTKMIDRLKASYTSDNVTTGDVISKSWNKFFIEYECCAINQVQGTTNDFDSTPWCTTAGSCQATASQIPKTCCNGVSEDDYGSAPTSCHSSVTPGTYKSNCMIPVKTLSTINIEECQISWLLITLLIIGTLEIAELLIELIMLVYICWLKKNKIKPKKTETATEIETKENHSTGSTESAKPGKKC